MPKTIRINPTLAENIPLVIKLARHLLGNKPGVLYEYELYPFEGDEYELTYTLIQFVADPKINKAIHPIRLDVCETLVENNGSFGDILTVTQSIIPQGDDGFFDETQSYVVKRMLTEQNAPSDKLNKPNWHVRIARRENYLGSHMPLLGIDYPLVETDDYSYIHMNRVPGQPVLHYRNRLSAREFLSLSCQLLTDIPKQIDIRLTHGKHRRKRIIHCDINSTNIMAAPTKEGWKITLIDMGLAKPIDSKGYYSTRQNYGAFISYDPELLRSDLQKVPKQFNQQTDSFALMMTILDIAGGQSLDNFQTRKSLLHYLEKPDLTDLFERMDFPSEMKAELIEVMHRALHPDRTERLSIQEVLHAFKAALENLPNKKHKILVSADEKQDFQISIEHLKNVIHTKNINYSEIEEITLHDLVNFVAKFRNLYTMATDETKRQFRLWYKKQISDTSTHQQSIIHNLMLFSVVKSGIKGLCHYSNEAWVRIILQHTHLTQSLREPCPLPTQWVNRFEALMNSIPLQLNSKQETQCRLTGKFKLQVSNFLQLNPAEKANPLCQKMLSQLEAQLKLDFKTWVKQLPELISLFETQYQCVVNLKKLSDDLPKYYNQFPELESKFENWKNTILYTAADDELPNRTHLRFYIQFFQEKLKLLLFPEHLDQNVFLIYPKLPALNQTFMSEASIINSINQLMFDNIDSFKDCYQKIDCLFATFDIYKILHHSELQDFETTTNKNQLILSRLLAKLVSNEQKDEFITQINTLHQYCSELYNLVNLLNSYKLPPSLFKAIFYIIDHDFEIERLAKVLRNFSKEFNKNSLQQLDRGLKTITTEYKPLSQSNPFTAYPLEVKLHAEIIRYTNSPRRYLPPEPQIYSLGNRYTFMNLTAGKQYPVIPGDALIPKSSTGRWSS